VKFLEMKQNKVSKTIRFCIERVNDFPIVFKFLGVTQIELPLFFCILFHKIQRTNCFNFFRLNNMNVGVVGYRSVCVS
jgi:hypothetical protein